MLWIELQAKRHIAEVTKAAAVFSMRVKTRKEKETAQKEKRIIPRYPQKNWDHSTFPKIHIAKGTVIVRKVAARQTQKTDRIAETEISKVE